MSVLDEVIALKNKGVSEVEIINSLRERGFSPNSISEALDQARIKSAVSSEESNVDEEMEPSIMRPEKSEPLPTEGEIADVDLVPPEPISKYTVKTPTTLPLHKELEEEEEVYIPQQEEAYIPQSYPTYQQYPISEYENIQNTLDADTMIEIAEQVFLEKIRPIQKQVEDFNEFKTILQSKVENISERLKRIESSIDKLQVEILEKVGSYGRGLNSIQKEMSMMQDSFGKALGTLVSTKENRVKSERTIKSSTKKYSKREKEKL
ncbi:MAG: hypothetical protein QXX55_02020 [Candidatus Pacearchaeota archaeon]